MTDMDRLADEEDSEEVLPGPEVARPPPTYGQHDQTDANAFAPGFASPAYGQSNIKVQSMEDSTQAPSPDASYYDYAPNSSTALEASFPQLLSPGISSGQIADSEGCEPIYANEDKILLIPPPGFVQTVEKKPQSGGKKGGKSTGRRLFSP